MKSRLNRRDFVRAMSSGVAVWASPQWLSAAGMSKNKPNIIFILADDMGYGDPHCYNEESKIPTPNMDRLAAQGVCFTDAHSGSSVCTPTRYGIITGRYSWRTSLQRGVFGGYSRPLIEPGRMTVASLLKQYGYGTACVGKWHLGMVWSGADDAEPNSDEKVDFNKPIKGGPGSVGFDYYYGISASLDMPPYVFIENDRTVALPTEHKPKEGVVREGAKDPNFKFEEVLPTLTKKAVEYITNHVAKTPDKPFFLYFAPNSPHTPVAPADFVKGKSKAGPYGDFVFETDWAVGEVMKVLDQHKLRDNTLIIMTSDNGSTNKPMDEYGHLPNGRLRGRKSTIWEGGHRVPFIARWPAQIKPGSISNEVIWLGDFMATCAAIASADLANDAAEDSGNILPALLGQKLEKPMREAIVHHSIDGMFAIRQGKWKLILGRGSGGWEGKGTPTDPQGQLYDMEKDPAEADNLYAKHPKIVERLTALLEKYKTEGRSRPLRGS